MDRWLECNWNQLARMPLTWLLLHIPPVQLPVQCNVVLPLLPGVVVARHLLMQNQSGKKWRRMTSRKMCCAGAANLTTSWQLQGPVTKHAADNGHLLQELSVV
jgi:hypothetical protein